MVPPPTLSKPPGHIFGAFSLCMVMPASWPKRLVVAEVVVPTLMMFLAVVFDVPAALLVGRAA